MQKLASLTEGGNLDCKNCFSSLGAGAKYCQECGQSVVTFDKPIRPVLTEMLHETLDIDGRVTSTLRTLVLKPGELSAAYRAGRRNSYTPPLRLYLVISIAFFLLLPMLDPSNQVMKDSNPLRVDIYPKIMFVLLPFFAFLLHLLFRGTFYLSNLVFAIHIHCIVYLVIALALPMEANEETYPVLIVMQIPLFLYLFSYLPLALKRYYAQSWSKIVVKFAALFLVYASTLGFAFDYAVQRWF